MQLLLETVVSDLDTALSSFEQELFLFIVTLCTREVLLGEGDVDVEDPTVLDPGDLLCLVGDSKFFGVFLGGWDELRTFFWDLFVKFKVVEEQ